MGSLGALALILLVTAQASYCVRWYTDVFCEDGEREGSVIYHVGDGWFYHFNNRRDTSSYYICVRGRSDGCPGRALLRDGRGFRHTQAHHGHNRDQQHSDVLALRRNILQRCRSMDYAPFSTILEEERRRFPAEVASRVTLAQMRTPMWYARQSQYPPIPGTLLEFTNLLNSPQYRVLSMTTDGRDNIYAGSATDENGDHHMLFASTRMLRLMSRVGILFSDGTFKIVPSLQSLQNRRAQVFNIVTTWRGHTILLATAVMESRTEQAYEAVLTLLRNILPQWRFTTVITDNEAAETNGWDNVFQPPRIQTCFWHTSRAFVTEIVALGLSQWFRDPQLHQFSSIVRMACALPLLPPALLRVGLAVVRRESRLQGGNFLLNLLTPFFNYLLINWVQHDQRRRFMSVYNSEHRTNNVCESLHNRMSRLLGNHPNIYRFLGVLVEMENTSYVDCLTLLRGHEASRARRTRAIINERVLRILWRELRRPPFGLRDAVRRFLLEASRRVRGIIDNHIRNHQ